MKLRLSAALALIAASPLPAQTAPDYTYSTPIAGSWTYAATTDGSEATFVNASALPQLAVHCARASRRVSIWKPGSIAVPFLAVWTSSASRSVPASFDPTSRRITIQLTAYDPLLDGVAFSRGRFAVGVSGGPALVVPAWAEAARVIEDCRS